MKNSPIHPQGSFKLFIILIYLLLFKFQTELKNLVVQLLFVFVRVCFEIDQIFRQNFASHKINPTLQFDEMDIVYVCVHFNKECHTSNELCAEIT